MICMDCGTDYTARPPVRLTSHGLEMLRGYRAEVDRLRTELDSMTTFAEDLRKERDRRLRSEGERGVERDALRAELAETKRSALQSNETFTQHIEELNAENDALAARLKEVDAGYVRARQDMAEVITQRNAARMERDALAAKLAESETRNKDLFRRLGEHMDDLGDARAENTALAGTLRTVLAAVNDSQAEQAVLDTVQTLVAAALGETGGTDSEDRPEHECGNDWFAEGDFCGGCDRDQAEAPGEQR
jgi:chromosome segregation ATPase